MIKTLIFIGFLFSYVIASATPQIPERIIVGRDTLPLYTTPLGSLDEALYAAIGKRIDESNDAVCSTDLGRGYQGLWMLRNDSLLLCHIVDTNNKPIYIDDILPDKYAAWYSGELRVPRGKVIVNLSGVGPEYEYETVYTLKKGVAVRSREYHNRIIGSWEVFIDSVKELLQTFEFPDQPDAANYTTITVSVIIHPTENGRIGNFRSPFMVFTESDGNRISISDPEHPYLRELFRCLTRATPYAIIITDQSQPFSLALPLKSPTIKNHP